MGKKVNFLFVVDVSGSMYGQKIASVNGVLAECLSEIRQLAAATNYEILVSVAIFAEKMRMEVQNEPAVKVSTPRLQVVKQSSGFYPLTSYSCLYQGMEAIFENNMLNDGNKGNNTFVFLFSDGKPDSEAYERALRTAKSSETFRNAIKYVVLTNMKSKEFRRDILLFADGREERVLEEQEVPAEIGKLQMTFFADTASQGSRDPYDRIFR